MAMGHSKSMFARNFKILDPLPPCSSLFILHVSPTPQHTSIRSAMLMNFQMKNR